MSLRCEEVRELLPSYVDVEARALVPVEEHLAACSDCARQYASYLSLAGTLSGLRRVELDPRPELLSETLELVRAQFPGALRIPAIGDLRRARERVAVLARERVAPLARERARGLAVASIGVAAVGAGAVLVWRRIARRQVSVAA
jgi:hypothetical protein